jgi:hypothetical protein
MPAVTTLFYATGQEESLCALDKYNAIVHLAWVPAFVDLINPYHKSPTNEAPMILVATPSKLSVIKAGVQVEEDTDHPRGD